MRRTAILLAFACMLTAGVAGAQSAPPPQTPPGPQTAAVPAALSPGDAWSYSVGLFTYFVPDDRVYVQPAVTADRGWLHLEGRFNYEDRDTGSVWIGRNFSIGEAVTFEITPMIGVVLGTTDGVAPGYRGSLGWRSLELYSETEYVFDAADSADNFLYTWSELSWAPAGGWRFGMAVQRTKLYQTEIDIQRGVLAGWSSDRVDLTAYVFEPWESHPTVVLGATVRF